MRRYALFLLSLFFILTPSVRADNIGDTRPFFVNTQFDLLGRSSLNATLRYVADHSYFYIEDAYWGALDTGARGALIDNLSNFSREFEGVIYPKLTGVFGSEPLPGIDGDSRLTIVVSRLIDNVGGYFDTINEYRRSQGAFNSNEREMIFVNVFSFPDARRTNAFMAHEFQHMISFNQKEVLRDVVDDSWVNEMRSEYAITFSGYNDGFYGTTLERRLNTYLDTPSDSLTEWRNDFADYAQVAMFGEFLAEHYGLEVVTGSGRNAAASVRSIDLALAQNNQSDTFEKAFAYYTAAAVINDTSVESKYGYTRPGLNTFRVLPTHTVNSFSEDLNFDFSDTYKDWQSRWLDLRGFDSGLRDQLAVTLNSTSTDDFTLYYVPFGVDGRPQALRSIKPLNNQAVYISLNDNLPISRILLMPIKHSKTSGFGTNEVAVNLNINLRRLARSEIPTPTPIPSITPSVVIPVTPEQYGLREGDFIRATGDLDIYIINQFGYKRLVLNPAICRQYAHLGRRGCFSAVREVTPTVRDAFVTSPYYTNGETNDRLVYKLFITGDDSAMLMPTQMQINNFQSEGFSFDSIFRINTLEQRSYVTR